MKSVINIFFGKIKLKRVSLQVSLDVLILFGSFVIAIVIYRKSQLLVNRYDFFIIAFSVFITIYSLVINRFYTIIISYVSAHAAVPVFLSIAGSSLIAQMLSIFLKSNIVFAEIFIYSLLSFIGILGSRFVYRGAITRKIPSDVTRVLIYGAGEAGRQMLYSLNSSKDYRCLAFIDDDQRLQGLSVSGLNVFSRESMQDLVSKLNIDLIVLAIPSISLEKRRDIILNLQNVRVKIRILPSLSELMSDAVNRSDVRPIYIEDVLGRAPVPPNQELMSDAIHGKTIMVTGAGGSIGSEICRQICISKPRKLILFDISEYALYLIHYELIQNFNDYDFDVIPVIGSVQDFCKVKETLKSFSVTTLFHAAAYKHVPLIELNIIEGVRNNVFGTKVIVDAAIDVGVSHVTIISTDKAVRPTNIMGATKRLSEFVCSSVAGNSNTTISMVRFGNVLGSSGSVVPLFEKQILKGGPVTVTHPEVTRFFMTISEAAQLVIQASAMAEGGEIYLLDMGDPVKILDLASSMVKLHGKVPQIVEGLNSQIMSDHIPIMFTGLRLGEKLYEELLVNNSSINTDHPLIMSAVESGPDKFVMDKYLKLLEQACLENNQEAIIKILIDVGTGLEHSNEF